MESPNDLRSIFEKLPTGELAHRLTRRQVPADMLRIGKEVLAERGIDVDRTLRAADVPLNDEAPATNKKWPIWVMILLAVFLLRVVTKVWNSPSSKSAHGSAYGQGYSPPATPPSKTGSAP
jgi:hypothetical protein